MFTKWVIVEIIVPNRRLKAALEDDIERQRRFGRMAQKVRVVLGSIRAADSLGMFWPPLKRPYRCHELKGDLKGQFSMDLIHPFRLLFIPVEEGTPSTDQRERWNAIKKIEIVGVEDTHG